MAAELARRVMRLHGKIIQKVDPFLRKNYGHGVTDYNHDLELIRNALKRLYGDAKTGLLADIALEAARRRAYLNTLDAVSQAVQSNFAITDHVIREGYSLAPYAAYISEYSRLSSLVDRVLRRRYPRALTDLRHMMDIFFSAEHTDHYLTAADNALRKALLVRGKSGDKIPRSKVTSYVNVLTPIAIHAGLIDSRFEGSDVRAAAEVSRFLFGYWGRAYTQRMLSLARSPDLAPIAISVAKHWNKNLNPRLWDAFYTLIRHGHDGVRELVNTDGRVAWEELWPHLSNTVIHTIKDTDKAKTFISVSKLNVVDQLRGLCDQPTCLYPPNEQGQRYGVDYVLNTRKGDIMPVIAVAHRVSKRSRADSVIGRITMFADPEHGNLHIVSTPVGSVDLDDFVRAAEAYARAVNRSAEQRVFERILVGGRGKHTFRLPVDDAYGDMIIRAKGQHYLRDAAVHRIEE